jgi:hypothetical protein
LWLRGGDDDRGDDTDAGGCDVFEITLTPALIARGAMAEAAPPPCRVYLRRRAHAVRAVSERAGATAQVATEARGEGAAAAFTTTALTERRTVFLVRHGESRWNASGHAIGLGGAGAGGAGLPSNGGGGVMSSAAAAAAAGDGAAASSDGGGGGGGGATTTKEAAASGVAALKQMVAKRDHPLTLEGVRQARSLNAAWKRAVEREDGLGRGAAGHLTTVTEPIIGSARSVDDGEDDDDAAAAAASRVLADDAALARAFVSAGEVP